MQGNGWMKYLVAAFAAATVLAALPSSEPLWAQKKQQQQAPPKVYRWVDENGEVHYSETLPPNWKGETHDELGHDGIVREEDVSHAPPPPAAEKKPDPAAAKGELPRDKSGLKRPDPLYSDAEKQQQLDRLLMLRYHSEQELLEAMEVEINQLKYDERLLNATRSSLEASLKSNIDLAGHRQRAGLEVGADTLKQIAAIRARLDNNDRSLRGLKLREDKIRETFNRDLERYRELVEMYSEEDAG